MANRIAHVVLIGAALALAPTTVSGESLARLAPFTPADTATPSARVDAPVSVGRIEIERMLAEPAARNSICLCEYAWDFTDPTGVPGFKAPIDTEPAR